MKKMKQWTVGFLSALLASLSCTVVFASAEEANDAVREAKNGVYAIQLVYHDSASDEEVPFIGGTAFFINEDTLLTCDHVVSMDKETESILKTYAQETYGSYSKDQISIEVVLQSDITAQAELLFSSEKGDWAVLQMKDDIDVTPMTFGDSDTCKNTQSVYAIGYPASVANTGSIENYTHSDITITNGKISKIVSIGGVTQIQHGATLSEGVSGGPLVDDNGAVVGINAAKVENQDYYFSVATEQILKILDQRKVQYTRNSGSQDSGDDVRTRLDKALSSAEGMELSAYTSGTANALQSAIDKAKKVQEDEGSSEEMRAAAEELENAILALQPKSVSILWIATLIAILLACAGIVILIVVIVKRKKRKKISPNVPNSLEPNATPAVPVIYILTRMKNGERAVIDKFQFTVGKDKICDYCIEGNSSISRSHAQFMLRGMECYVMDLHSTNGTFVNGEKLASGAERKVKAGDIIKLSDEEFKLTE